MEEEQQGHRGPDISALSRRRFIFGVGSGIIGGTLLGAATARATISGSPGHPAISDEVVAGAIESIDSTSVFQVGTRGEPTRVVLAENAHVWRDARATLSDFRAGDEVVAEGRWVSDSFVASALTNLYYALEGRVVEERGDYLRSAAWQARFVAETRLQRGTSLAVVRPNNFRPGEFVNVLARRGSQADEYVALRVYAA
jgi:hypothetical protein